MTSGSVEPKWILLSLDRVAHNRMLFQDEDMTMVTPRQAKYVAIDVRDWSRKRDHNTHAIECHDASLLG